jgi:hypothetical protein
MGTVYNHNTLKFYVTIRSSSSSSSSVSSSSSSSESSSSSVSSSSSTSVSSSCTQQFYDVTNPQYWDVVSGTWDAANTRWLSSDERNPFINLTPSAGTLTENVPQRIRFTIDFQDEPL